MIDFSHVAPEHAEIHAELENWARWCIRGSRGGGHQTPMFRDYRPPSMYDTAVEPRVVNSLAAVATQKRYIRLPGQNRLALKWSYVEPWMSPGRVQRELAVTKAELLALLIAGRAMMARKL